jgi:NTE family protein
LLEDQDIHIRGLSGASAGAMNAVVLASGYGTGGRDEARRQLRSFWETVGKRKTHNPLGLSIFDTVFKHWAPIAASPVYSFYDMVSRLVSPYQLNPLNMNPLRNVVADHVNFDAIRQLDNIRVFVSTTNVRTGHHRIFRNEDLSLDAVLASTCLPVLFQTVEIDGEAYWDGGYTANPALLPLIEESEPNDLILIQINPVDRPEIPYTAHTIIDRINEISFNSSLNQELRTIALIKRLLADEAGLGHHYHSALFGKIAALCVHRIEAQKEMRSFGAASKLSSNWPFIAWLHDIGYDAADTWLAQHRGNLGRRSTIELFSEYADIDTTNDGA